MGRSKKKYINETLTADTSENTECCLNLRIEIQSLRGKNMDLVQNVAKLHQEKSILQKQIATLQKDYLSLNSKFVNLKSIFTSVDTTVKIGFPKLAEVVQHLAQVMHLCSIGAVVSNSNKDPKTQAVSPHTVNGTVIRNPTITLARFSDNSPSLSGTTQRSPNSNATLTGSPNLSSNSIRNRQPNVNIYEDSMPGPSRRLSINVFDRENSEHNESTESNNENDTSEIDGHHRRKVVMSLMDSSDEECEEDQNDLLDAAMGNSDDISGRLETIQEENEGQYSSLNSSTDRVREIRIYLSPLHNDAYTNNVTEIPKGSFSGEPSRTVTENSFLDEIHQARDNVSRYRKNSMVSRNSDIFTLDDAEIWGNNKINSFIFSPIPRKSASPNVPEDSPSSNSILDDSDKYLTMMSLGLQPTRYGQELPSSTPVVTTPRKSSRYKKQTEKLLDCSVSLNKSSISKRKSNYKEKNVAQVIVKRLKLEMNNPLKKLSESLDISPKKLKKRQNKSPSKSPSKKSPSPSKTLERNTQQRLKKKGKENRKTQQSIQIKSPRPKRAAQPTTLREPNINSGGSKICSCQKKRYHVLVLVNVWLKNHTRTNLIPKHSAPETEEIMDEHSDSD